MLGLKKVLLGVTLAAFSGVVLADNPHEPPPPDVSIPQPAGPGYPAGTPQPTVDAASLAYLPWVGANVRLLVNYSDFFYQLEKSNMSGGSSPYMAAVTTLANNQLVPTLSATAENSSKLTLQNVQAALAYGDTAALASTKYASIPGTDISDSTPLSDDFAFNSDNILGVLGYDSNQAEAVKGLIAFLGGSAKPLGGLTFSTTEKIRKQQLAGTDVQNYLLSSRTAAAAQSVALSNLNYLAQERLILKDLGTKSGMTTLPTDGNQKPIADASQLQLEQFLVDRRVGNSSWYTNVNTSSAIAVQRETLFVLAEVSKQLFDQKILMERMLAQTAVMEQQAAQINRAKLDYDQQTIQKSLIATAGAQ